MSTDNDKINITLDISKTLKDACVFFCLLDSSESRENIEDYLIVNNLKAIIYNFENQFKEILTEKLLLIAKNIDLFDFKIRIRINETRHLGYEENGSYIMHFAIKVYTIEDVFLGEIHNEDFSLHKYNFINAGIEKSRFLSEVSIFSRMEEDCLKRISSIPVDDFILRHESRSLPSIFYVDNLDNPIKDSVIWELPFFKQIIDIFKKELITIKNDNIHDFTSNGEFGFKFKVEYLIGKENILKFIYFENIPKYGIHSLICESDFNDKINNNDLVSSLMFKIFIENHLLSSEVLKIDNISYKEAFEISKLLGY